MEQPALLAATAGLLHDLGKLAQRAGQRPTHSWDSQDRALYKYQHALLSLEVALQVLPKPLQDALSGIAQHHQPHDGLSRVVARADRLASSEREDSDAAEPQALLSPFASVSLTGRAAPQSSFVPLRSLAMEDEALFPGSAPSAAEAREAYRLIWAGFLKEAVALRQVAEDPGASLEAWLGNMQQLLKRHSWAVPAAAYYALPDISLYDHSRMTAALAACLALAPGGMSPEGELTPERLTSDVALLVGGDVSGIQDFIYTISSRGAASALRGRSFYLQLLTDAAASYLLRTLNLPPTNLVYASGGHFYLLAPPGSEETLREAQRYISRVLLRHHGGDLYLAVAGLPLTAEDLTGERMSTRWGELAGRLREAKDRRFAELAEEMHPLVFEPWRELGDSQLECAICHHEHPQTRSVEGVRVCPACQRYDELGDQLRRARYLVLDQVTPALDDDRSAEGGPDAALEALGVRARLYQALPTGGSPECLREVWALDDEAFELLQPSPRCIVGRRLLVNVTPQGQLGVATTDEMAQASQGIERLGVMRLDMDDLGQVFSRGLGKRGSLSRIATLSLAVQLFFEGWVEQLGQGLNQGGAPRVYSIYSGGDDLFFVGAWDAVVKLAQDIRSDLHRYTGGHPDLHVSGGVVLVEPGYPLYRAAIDAKQAEDAAKAYDGKDAFTFLGHTMPWQRLSACASWAERLRALIAHPNVGVTLLRWLMEAQEMRRDALERTLQAAGDVTPGAVYGSWMPRLDYRLARLQGRARGAQQELEALRKELRQEDHQSIAWLGTAARWAELAIRGRGND